MLEPGLSIGMDDVFSVKYAVRCNESNTVRFRTLETAEAITTSVQKPQLDTQKKLLHMM